jgi:hypothetical protein
VTGDFTRKQVRAVRTIEKDEEILADYCYGPSNNGKFIYGSKKYRQQLLLENCGFLCQCSVCSMEGETLEENEKLRAEIREKHTEFSQLLNGESSDPRKCMERAIKVFGDRLTLVKKLDIRAAFVYEMINFHRAAIRAKMLGISVHPEPNVLRQEALKWARICGDSAMQVFLQEFKYMM